MLVLYVFGLPLGALLMVWRMRRRAERKNQSLHECKGHATWGLFYSAFRDDAWWWEGTVALRKIGIAMIGVFGAAMEEMQVLLTLVLVFLIILMTAVRRPYGESPAGLLLQRLEVSTLSLLFLTLWAASVFTVYPRCEVREGESVWWCEIMSVIVGLADIVVVVVVIVLFVRLKGAGAHCCYDRCFGKLPEPIRDASVRLGRRLTREWDLRHGGEAAVQARARRRTVESKGASMIENPMEQITSGDNGGSRQKSANQKAFQRGVEMVEVNMGPSAALPSRKAKRQSYMKRQAALKKLNEHRRTERVANNPTMGPPTDAGAGENMSAFRDAFQASHAYVAEADDEIDLVVGDAVDRAEDLGGGWWRGRNVRTGRVGAFPASFVE